VHGVKHRDFCEPSGTWVIRVSFTVLNESVVILAQDHNPSILHPYFLSAQSVVPEEWELAEPPVCTPPLSMVTYKNGITFTVESVKLQVAKSPATPRLRDSKLPDLASKYISILPHVRYTAVGMNFGAILDDPDPSRHLMGQFLTPGPWNSDDLLVQELALRFVYSVDSGTLNLSCNPGDVRDNALNRTVKGIIINANYHFGLPGANPVREAVDTIGRFGDLSDHFNQVGKRIFEIEE